MASEDVESFFLAVFWVLSVHIVRVSLMFKSNDLLSALVEVSIEENKLFESWHAVDFVQVEVNFHASVLKNIY